MKDTASKLSSSPFVQELQGLVHIKLGDLMACWKEAHLKAVEERTLASDGSNPLPELTAWKAGCLAVGDAKLHSQVSIMNTVALCDAASVRFHDAWTAATTVEVLAAARDRFA